MYGTQIVSVGGSLSNVDDQEQHTFLCCVSLFPKRITRKFHCVLLLMPVVNVVVPFPRVIKQSFLSLLLVILSQLITPLRCDITLFVMRRRVPCSALDCRNETEMFCGHRFGTLCAYSVIEISDNA